VRSLKNAGRLGDAQIFPTVHGAAGGDPRSKYSDVDLRSWSVVFDGDANTWVTQTVPWGTAPTTISGG